LGAVCSLHSPSGSPKRQSSICGDSKCLYSLKLRCHIRSDKVRSSIKTCQQ
jgi:hypothetical protein